MMDSQRTNLDKLGTSDAWNVPVSSTPVLIICPFRVNWLTDFSRLSLLIIKEVWQRPFLLLSLFFIHGHELPIAVHRGHRAERVHPITSLLLMSWRREKHKDKRLEERGLRLDLVVYRLFLCCQRCRRHQHYSMSFSRAHWTNPNALSGSFLGWRSGYCLGFVPECATSLSRQDKKITLEEEFLPHRLFVSPSSPSFPGNVWMWRITCADRRARTISPPLAATPTCEIWTQGTATHNAPAICSFISLEHPALVQALKFINIHTTFIYGNVAHGVGVLMSETG